MLQITFQSVFQTTTAPAFTIGTEAQTADGREWVYVVAGTGGLARGDAGVPVATTTVTTVSSSVDIYNRIVFINETAAGWTPGIFADSYVTVNTGTGVGQMAQIMSNTADQLQLYPAFALTTALAVADSGIAIVSPGRLVKALVTSKKQNVQGIAQIAFDAGDYGWVLKRGAGVVFAGVSLTPVGSNFTSGDDTAGRVILGVATEGPFAAQNLGKVLVVNPGADQLALVQVNIE